MIRRLSGVGRTGQAQTVNPVVWQTGPSSKRWSGPAEVIASHHRNTRIARRRLREADRLVSGMYVNGQVIGARRARDRGWPYCSHSGRCRVSRSGDAAWARAGVYAISRSWRGAPARPRPHRGMRRRCSGEVRLRARPDESTGNGRAKAYDAARTRSARIWGRTAPRWVR